MIKVLLLIYLTGGAWQDLKSGRVSNWWHALCALCFVTEVFIRGPSGGAAGFAAEVLAFMARSFLLAAAFFPLFLCRMIGAGDVKVMALISGCMGITNAGFIIFLSLLISAVWSFLFMIHEDILIQRIAYFTAYVKTALITGSLTSYRCQGDSPLVYFCFVPFIWCGFLLRAGGWGGVI